MDYSLSNPELVVMLLIAEGPGITGYAIRKRAEERGLDAWAGVAPSSIYNSLKGLEQRRLATSAPDTGKTGRGPRGRSFELTRHGRGELRRNVAAALTGGREHDPRFNIALSGIESIPAEQAAICLRRRSDFLEAEANRLRRRSEAEPLPLSASLLFDRIINSIDAERSWLERACDLISNRAEEQSAQ